MQGRGARPTFAHANRRASKPIVHASRFLELTAPSIDSRLLGYVTTGIVSPFGSNLGATTMSLQFKQLIGLVSVLVGSSIAILANLSWMAPLARAQYPFKCCSERAYWDYTGGFTGGIPSGCWGDVLGCSSTPGAGGSGLGGGCDGQIGTTGWVSGKCGIQKNQGECDLAATVKRAFLWTSYCDYDEAGLCECYQLEGGPAMDPTGQPMMVQIDDCTTRSTNCS